MRHKAERASEGGIRVRENIGRNIGAITMDAVAATIGNMVVDRVATASTSTLYGPVGNVDDMVRQAAQSYRGDPGTQFSQQANWNLSLQSGVREQAFVGGLQDQFGQLANDALAASRAQDQALKQQLGSEFAGSANWALAGQRAEHAAAAARINTAGLDFGRGPNNWSDDSPATGGNDILARLGSEAQAQLNARLDRLKMPGLAPFDDTPKLVALDGNATRWADNGAALLGYLDTQGNQALSGLLGSAAMLAKGDIHYGLAVAESTGPLDALWAPGGGRATSLASVRRASIASGERGLLPTEGNVGTYSELLSAGSKGDNVTPHHIPSANYMSQFGIAKGDGIAINMEQPVPGAGGRHRATFTYGTTADVGMSPRDALAAGVWDARQIYQRDGLYSQIRPQLQELIQQSKVAYPNLFGKY